MLSDFNCYILEIDRFKLISSLPNAWEIEKQKIYKDVDLLGKLGFHKLVLQVDYRNSLPPLQARRALTELKIKYEKEILRGIIKHFRLHIVPVLYFTEELPFFKGLKYLTAEKTNYIFLELPLGRNFDRLAVAINQLLYTKKLCPVFVNFQTYTTAYPTSDIQRLINIKGAGYQFSLRSAIEPKNIDIIKHILNNGGVVLIGTALDHAQLNTKEIQNQLLKLKRLLGQDVYTGMILRARALLP